MEYAKLKLHFLSREDTLMKKITANKLKMVCVFTFFVAVLLIVLRIYKASELQRKDYRLISTMEYDTVFLSMYPIDTYLEEYYSYYRAMTLFKASYCIPSLSVLEDYMQHIDKSGNIVTTAYLGIRPELIEIDELQEFLNLYPDIIFEIVLSYPSSEYWQSLSQEDYEQIIAAYRDFICAVPEILGANFYFFGGQEWIIANPANYQDQWLVNEDMARMLMTHSDEAHGYLVTSENAADSADALVELTRSLRTMPPVYPDLSNHCVVFFGDSVIGNYTDSFSIPGVVAGLTGAEVYNCGYGGNSAALGPDVPISLPGIVGAFFQKDLSLIPNDVQVYIGVSDYLENAPFDKQTCFVINYGLNDYFCGYPLSSEDPYDITTYCGAVRSAVAIIRENQPDAQIILCTPNFTAAFEDGTEVHNGFVLLDYVNAILSLSQELQTDVLDNYHELGITHENNGQRLDDQVHPNPRTRFQIGSKLSSLIR